MWSKREILAGFGKLILVVIMMSGCHHLDEVQWPETDDRQLSFRTVDTLDMERDFLHKGLVDVQILDSSIQVQLRYGTEDNFMGVDFYDGFNKCYLQPEVARMLLQAQLKLKENHPALSLLVWDAARPRSVQKEMWRLAEPPPGISKGFFVSNPARGSLHNFGCAVDVTLIDQDGFPLDMGTDFDFFGPESWPVKESEMLKLAKLSHQQIRNRNILRSAMYAAGFWNIQTEWWHFNAMRRQTADERYQILE